MPTFRHNLKSRFAVFAAVIVVVLGVLLVKLWTMQVLAGAAYAKDAEENRIQEIHTQPTRGRILDRAGRELVSNRPTLAVLVDPQVRDDEELLTRLSAALNMPAAEIKEKASSVKEEALAPRVVAIDVPLKTAAYLSEHQAEFPGISVETKAVRRYPQGRTAAQVLGYTGEISQSELDQSAFKTYELGDVVGKAGAEAAFESLLQGDRGVTRFEVDARGAKRRVVQKIEPVPGRDVQLTIDSRVQRDAESALARAMSDAHKANYPHARAGAAVAIDVKTGEVIALASLPTYDPSVFLGGVSQKNWRSLTATRSDFPLTNRAIMAQYPAASTFKAFTGLAGLTNGVITPATSFDCQGRWVAMGKQWPKWCWNHYGHGWESLLGAVKDSCDVYFYNVGYGLYKEGGERLQKFVRQFGFGKPTGIELPGEAPGRVPDKKWKAEFNRDYPEYRQWNPGDTVNIAIGQGDLLVTPLQLAMGYSAIVNGGKLMQPHVLKRVKGSGTAPGYVEKPKVVGRPKVPAADLATMKQALHEVTTSGTGAGAFRNFPVSVAGKTGTGQVAGKDDYALFVGYAPAEAPKYVVVVVIEEGGHGGSIAGPAARDIFASLFRVKAGHVTATDNSR
jgi:penicillin-binding protein 2